jgi:hypothetical protein
MAKKFISKNSKISIKEGFSLFCKETSLHGWSYFNHEMSKIWKLFLAAFFVLVTIASAALIWTNTNQVRLFYL